MTFYRRCNPKSPICSFLPRDFNYVGHCYLKCEPGETAEIKNDRKDIERNTEKYSSSCHYIMEDMKSHAIENKLKGIIHSFSIVSLLFITFVGEFTSTIITDTERKMYKRK